VQFVASGWVALSAVNQQHFIAVCRSRQGFIQSGREFARGVREAMVD